MSNIYIQEPPALGKVLLKTTVGDIDLELWTKEAPKACRNFIQLCMEGYYNGTIFHRVVPDFIVQGGDPKGDGTGGESVYGAPFKDEFHTRLRFNRRGLVAMANGGKDDNASQFFFTLNATPELQNKHTIFAKVTGETVFNMLKLAEGETDIEDRPMYPHKITDSQILVNPFDDIVPRVVEKQKEEPIDKKKKKEKGVKNFGLLSFGMEAEEEEDQFTEFRGKPKSTHDVLDDPKLSKLTSNDLENGDDVSNEFKEDSENTEAAVANIRGKLLSKKDKNADKKPEEEESKEVKSDEEIEEYYLGKDKKEARKKQAEEIRKQIKDLKREMSSKKNQIDELVSDKKSSEKKKAIENNELVEQFENEQKKYKKKMEELPKKGASREEFTLALLKKFKQKLSTTKEKFETDETTDDKKVNEDETDDINSDDWLAHKLHFEEKGQVLAKDASTKGDDWYDIYDPRNPINKRKRDKGKESKPGKSQRRT